MSTCKFHLLFPTKRGRPCKHVGSWIVRINDDPDTDTTCCRPHADMVIKRCWPTPVTLIMTGETTT